MTDKCIHCSDELGLAEFVRQRQTRSLAMSVEADVLAELIQFFLTEHPTNFPVREFLNEFASYLFGKNRR